MRQRLIVLFIFSIIALTFAACEKGPSPADVVRQYEQAVNSEDVPALEALLDSNCMFEFERRQRISGWEKIEPLVVWDTTVNTRMTITIDSTVGNTVFARNAQTNDWYTGFGVDTFVFITWFEVDSSRIAAVHTFGTPESRVRFLEQWKRLHGYMKLAHPEELKQLMPEGGFSYTPENARLWMEVFKDWQEMHEE